MSDTRVPALLVAVVAVSLAVGPITGALAAHSTGTLTVDATPSGPSEADATHTLTMPLDSDTAVANTTFADVLVDYSLAQPTADVSNVGVADVERIGVDRDDDAVGTRIDDEATVTSVSGKKDGKAVRLALNGTLTLQGGDEVVVVLQNVQNPQNPGNSTVELTVNTQGGATNATGTVHYEQHDAAVTLSNQTTGGDTVVVDRVNLSEAGYVAVQNASGVDTGAVRGSSAYLPAGVSTNVSVTLDEPVESNTTLYAQAYTDSDGDRQYDFVTSGGEQDGVYRTGDDNVDGTDSAAITYDPDASTTTPTPTATPTPTPTPTPTTTDSSTPTESSSTTETTDAATATDATTETDATATDSDATTTERTTGSGTEATSTTTTVAVTEEMETASPTTTGTGPGFGLAATLAALLALAALLGRR